MTSLPNSLDNYRFALGDDRNESAVRLIVIEGRPVDYFTVPEPVRPLVFSAVGRNTAAKHARSLPLFPRGPIATSFAHSGQGSCAILRPA